MKTIIPIFLALCLMALGCTETEYIEVEKLIRDTVKVDRFIDRYFSNTDTVEIPVAVQVPVPTRVQDTVIINHTDTVYIDRIDTVYQENIVYVQRVDSIFVTRTVYLTDTVVVRETHYTDTLFVWGGRDTYSIPQELMPIVTEFYKDAASYGKSAPGGEVIIEIVSMDDALQAISFEFNTQVVIRVNDNLTSDERFLPLYRELARWQLGKEYSQDPESVLYPFYPNNIIRWSTRAQHKEKLKEIFL